MYKRDGLHFNWRGTSSLAGRFANVAHEDLNYIWQGDRTLCSGEPAGRLEVDTDVS